MDPLASALAAWIAFHVELGVDLDALLLPGATADETTAVEKALGHALPEDLRTLYRHADGQIDLLDEALAEHRERIRMHED